MASSRTMVAAAAAPASVQDPSHTSTSTPTNGAGPGTGANGTRAAPPPTPRSRISSSSAATIDNDGLLTPSPSKSHFTCAPIPILQPRQSQSHNAGFSNSGSYPASSLSSSPRRYATDPIPEEDDETESESANEPITPVSGRESREFQPALLDLPNSDLQPQLETEFIASPGLAEDSATTTPTTPGATADSISTTTTGLSQKAIFPSAAAYRRPPPLRPSPDPTSKFSQDTPTSTSPPSDYSPTTSNRTSSVSQYQCQQPSLLLEPQQSQQQYYYQSEHPSATEASSPPPRRPSLGNLSLRGASKSFLGVGTKMTSLFRRSASNVTDGATMEFREPVYQNGGAGGAVLDTTTPNTPAKATPAVVAASHSTRRALRHAPTLRRRRPRPTPRTDRSLRRSRPRATS
ncbi:hypothetical protein PG997_010662 [Apiospora hydei]|uniref:Uncharacterized protein n=1 Tax=Apiospora hydei TaxID=1337664 RepID=A0ABR1VKI9_9PEZI